MTYAADDIKSAMSKHAGIHVSELTAGNLRHAGCLETVAVLPENFNERLSYLANVLVQALTRNPKDDELRAAVGTLAQALCYMMNSTSWHEGELFEFDRMELSRKLKRLVDTDDSKSAPDTPERPTDTGDTE